MMAWRGVAVFLVGVGMAAGAPAQGVDWRSSFCFYGDNTEFFTPYRTGETILGAWVTSALALQLGPRSEVLAGFFADRRSGSEDTWDEVKPVLSFRHRTATSLAVMGSLQTERRHGLLEPLQATTLELTRQVEYGLQWIETRPRWRAEGVVNWQHLNTAESREIFDYSVIASARVWGFVSVDGQLHGLHHGGQLHQVGPVTNNVVWAAGVRGEWSLGDDVSIRGRVLRLQSKGKLDPFQGGPTIRGHGLYARGDVEVVRRGEVSLIWWRGRDFISSEGDHNYGSVDREGTFHRSRRSYQELVLAHRRALGAGVDLAVEGRLHRIDGDVEYSYRIVVRAPFELHLR